MEDITEKTIEQVEATGAPVKIADIRKVPNLKIMQDGNDFYWSAFKMQKPNKEKSLQDALMELSVMVYMEKGI